MNNIRVEDLSDIRKKVTVEIPHEEFQAKVDAQYRDLKRTVQIKGFRKGKVPLNILKAYYREKVESDVTRELIEETFEPGLAEKDITPVQVVKIQPETVETDKPFTYTAEVEVPPPVALTEYKGLSVKKYIRQVKEEEIDARLEELRQTQARMTPIPENAGVKEGHHLVVDIKAMADGKEISSLTVSDYSMELGRDFYIPDFDERLVGMRVDDTHRIAVHMPKDYVQKSLAGRPVDFQITIKEAKERVPPALDDDFAKDLGEFGSLDELKAKMREDRQQQLDRKSEKEVEDQIVDALVEKHPMDVPAVMIDKQVEHLLNETRGALARYGVDPATMPPPTQEHRDRFRPSAERTVKAGLIIKAVAEAEGLKVSDEELDAELEKRAESMGVSVDHLKDELTEHNLLGDFKASLLQDKAFAFLKEHAEISEEEPPPEEGPQPTGEPQETGTEKE